MNMRNSLQETGVQDGPPPPRGNRRHGAASKWRTRWGEERQAAPLKANGQMGARAYLLVDGIYRLGDVSKHKRQNLVLGHFVVHCLEHFLWVVDCLSDKRWRVCGRAWNKYTF